LSLGPRRIPSNFKGLWTWVRACVFGGLLKKAGDLRWRRDLLFQERGREIKKKGGHKLEGNREKKKNSGRQEVH